MLKIVLPLTIACYARKKVKSPHLSPQLNLSSRRHQPATGASHVA